MCTEDFSGFCPATRIAAALRSLRSTLSLAAQRIRCGRLFRLAACAQQRFVNHGCEAGAAGAAGTTTGF
jgi:hypothetical protein